METCSPSATASHSPPLASSSPDEIGGKMESLLDSEEALLGARPKQYSNVIVDDSPLQNQMEKNKESLKVKLMVRRPMTTLVEQGILPSPKTSPALYEQKQKLERAKKGDLLKSMIAKRPDRQALVNRHILEDVRPGVDPSLCDKQRQLKRAKLQDTLSNQLLARPGPLELIKKNILHIDENVELAVKEGQIQFRPTNEGVLGKPVDLPSKYSIDEDSNSEGVQSPPDLKPPPTPSPITIQAHDVIKSESHDNIFSTPKVSELKRRASDVGLPFGQPISTSSSSASVSSLSNRPATLNLNYRQREAPGKDTTIRKGKKAKPKGQVNAIGKQRAIKFHEYKGPSTSSKRGISADDPRKVKGQEESTAYELLLKQQTLLLQWQVENQNKYPILLPAPSSSTSSSSSNCAPGTSNASSSPSPTNSSRAQTPLRLTFGAAPCSPAAVTCTTLSRNNPPTLHETALAQKMLNRIDDMKVNELKSELKKRNLTVSGAKPQLIERLRPHLEAIVAFSNGGAGSKLQITPSSSGTFMPQTPSSPASTLVIVSKENSPAPLSQQPGTPMETLSQPSTPQDVSSHESSPPLAYLGEFGSILAETPVSHHTDTMEIDFDMDMLDGHDNMDTNNAVSVIPTPPPPPPPPSIPSTVSKLQKPIPIPPPPPPPPPPKQIKPKLLLPAPPAPSSPATAQVKVTPLYPVTVINTQLPQVEALQQKCDQQQAKIEELEIALQKTQQLLAQHQTQELQNHMNQLQAVQQKVVADQAQLRSTINTMQQSKSSDDCQTPLIITQVANLTTEMPPVSTVSVSTTPASSTNVYDIDLPSDLSMDLTNFDPIHVQSLFDKYQYSSHQHQMEVKDDVATFLDSICADNQQQQASTKILLNHELNGNNGTSGGGLAGGDLMPRGDPFMGSFSNSSNSNNDFGL